MKTVDLRSDTVTQPGHEMRRVIADAEVGDDVYGEDPTVNALEDRAARLLGKDAALFCSSGTQSNLLAILGLCQRGDEFIAAQGSHAYLEEGGGAAVLGSVQPQPLANNRHGVVPLDDLRAAIKPRDFHYARTRLICLENTFRGACLPGDYTAAVRLLCDKHGLSLHLDGARLFNAAIRTGVAVAALAAPFDTVSICLSKGLGAPMGSLLCGSEALIDDARRWRKMLGGATRQVGMMAAAGLYALENNIDRLHTDHDNAQHLADGLANVASVSLLGDVQTNMVFIEIAAGDLDPLLAAAVQRGIRLPDDPHMRLVTHLDIDRDGVDRVIGLFEELFGGT